MLVVTRKVNQGIVIGEGIEVIVLRHGRDGVRLGITAPPHVPVHRREVYDTIRTQNASAAGGRVEIEGLVEHLRKRMQQP